MSPVPAPAADDAPERRLSWRALIAGLFALNVGIGALNGKQPSDLYWISSSIAQVGIMAALVLALLVPAFAFLRRFLSRLNDLNALPAGRSIAAHLGLGAVATSGSLIGSAVTGDPPYLGPLDVAILFPVNAICAALIFLLTARLIFHRAARIGPTKHP
jgi:hypothetical protein